jgi:hypothetical protein
MIKGKKHKKYEGLFNGQLNEKYEDSDITGTELWYSFTNNKVIHGNGLL